MKCVSHFSFFYEFSAFAALIIMAVSPVISFLKFTNTSPLTPLRLTSSLHYLAVKNNWTRFGVWSSTNYHEESCVSLCDARTPDSWITSACSTDRAKSRRLRCLYKRAFISLHKPHVVCVKSINCKRWSRNHYVSNMYHISVYDKTTKCQIYIVVKSFLDTRFYLCLAFCSRKILITHAWTQPHPHTRYAILMYNKSLKIIYFYCFIFFMQSYFIVKLFCSQ